MISPVLRDGRLMKRVAFDETFFTLSGDWLQDSELVWLIMATPELDPVARRAWFDGLPGRTDYAIWGMECDGVPVGVLGIKLIGVDDGAEYFMYLGNRDYWRKGIGRWALSQAQDEVRARGLRWVYGRVGLHNERAVAADLAHGFRLLREEGAELVIVLGVDEPVR